MKLSFSSHPPTHSKNHKTPPLFERNGVSVLTQLASLVRGRRPMCRKCDSVLQSHLIIKFLGDIQYCFFADKIRMQSKYYSEWKMAGSHTRHDIIIALQLCKRNGVFSAQEQRVFRRLPTPFPELVNLRLVCNDSGGEYLAYLVGHAIQEARVVRRTGLSIGWGQIPQRNFGQLVTKTNGNQRKST